MNTQRVSNGMRRLALLALAACVTPLAHAITYQVTTTADLPDDGLGVTACHTSAGGCSLRAAIMKANQVEGTDIIHVPAGTYTLTATSGTLTAAVSNPFTIS